MSSDTQELIRIDPKKRGVTFLSILLKMYKEDEVFGGNPILESQILTLAIKLIDEEPEKYDSVDSLIWHSKVYLMELLEIRRIADNNYLTVTEGDIRFLHFCEIPRRRPEADDKVDIARALISHLWRMYDHGGISRGRSQESIILELSMDLIPHTDGSQSNREKGFLELIDKAELILV